MRQRTVDRPTTSITVQRNIADTFARFAKENGHTVSSAAERALIWWINKGYKQQLQEYLDRPSTIEPSKQHDLFSDMVKDEIKPITKSKKEKK